MLRKEEKLKERWQVENVYEKVSKEKRGNLKEDCIFEDAMRVWHEMKGTTKEGGENGEKVRMLRINGDWRELSAVSGKEVYNQLVRMRYRLKEENKSRGNHATKTMTQTDPTGGKWHTEKS